MTIRSKTNSPEFEEAFTRIFGDKLPERGSWIQDPETGKLISKDELANRDPDAPAVHGSIEAFKSPIDGTIIDDRRTLREHNRKHGVTNIQDYGDNGGQAFFERKHKERSAAMTGQSREEKRERVETIKRAIAQHS